VTGLATRHSRQLVVRQVLNLAQNQRAPEFCRSRPDLGVLGKQLMLAREPSAGGPTLTVAETPNWGGYATTQSEFGAAINGAEGTWTVPPHTAGLAPSAEATWVGVGGGIGGETRGIGLIQAGTEMQTNEGYRSVWEYIGTSGCVGFCGQYSSINAISPGDSVTGQVFWGSSTYACFYLEDWSRNSGSQGVCQTVNIPYDHTSAEWVDEQIIGECQQ
jgi:Peptidase A4 family